MENIKKYSITTYLKFILFSAFGIFSFFIDITFPAYSVKLGIFSFEVAESTTNLVAHLTNFIKGALWTGSFKVMPYIVWIVVIFGMIDLYLKRKKILQLK